MKPKVIENVSLGDALTGKIELPEGVTRGKLLGVALQIDLNMVLTHSRVERDGNRARLYLHGELRATGLVNGTGRLDGELVILFPKGGIWIVAQFADGEPCGEWREFTPSGILLPGKPLEWLQWENMDSWEDIGGSLH